MSADHVVTIDLEYGWGGSVTLACKARADAMCHAVWDCECEWWCKSGIGADGKPWHAPGDYSEPERERHVGTFDPTQCNWKDWAENSDECLRGKVTFAVTPEWDGEVVLFHADAAESEGQS